MFDARELAFVLTLCACAGPRPVVFQGSSEPRVVGPEEVVVASALPRDAERLGTLSARCEGEVAWESFDKMLSDVDCTEQRLERMLRDAAAENGGDVLAALECRNGASRSCRATLGRLRRTPSAHSVRPERPDVRSILGASVRVAFEPRGEGIERSARGATAANGDVSPRPEHAVRDLPVVPPSHVVVGSLETSCGAECDELSVRDALRIAAGRLGMADVAGVRCLPWSGGHRCIGAGLLPESDFIRGGRPSGGPLDLVR